MERTFSLVEGRARRQEVALQFTPPLEPGTVRYNHPSARGRVLFGGIVKWDSVWCPGADEGTRLETTSDLAGQVHQFTAVAGESLAAGLDAP